MSNGELLIWYANTSAGLVGNPITFYTGSYNQLSAQHHGGMNTGCEQHVCIHLFTGPFSLLGAISLIYGGIMMVAHSLTIGAGNPVLGIIMPGTRHLFALIEVSMMFVCQRCAYCFFLLPPVQNRD